MLHTLLDRGRSLLTRQELALVLVTAVWGATFLVVHIAVQYSGPWFFVGMRFLAAGLISALVFHRVLRGMQWKDLGAGSAIGVMIFLGYGLQTVGLQTVSSSTSAFITALYVPIVPLLQWLVFRKPPRLLTWVGVLLAFAGLVLLSDPGSVGFAFGPGETVTLVSTLPMAVEIVLIGLFAGRVHVGRVTVVQLLVAGLLSLLTMPLVGERAPDFSWVWLSAAVALGAASCVIQLTMNWAQRSVSPTRATIIYAGEPVWAGIVGRLAGDRLPAIAILGAALIVAGAVVSELHPRSRAERGVGELSPRSREERGDETDADVQSPPAAPFSAPSSSPASAPSSSQASAPAPVPASAPAPVPASAPASVPAVRRPSGRSAAAGRDGAADPTA